MRTMTGVSALAVSMLGLGSQTPSSSPLPYGRLVRSVRPLRPRDDGRAASRPLTSP
jgi:hypothetical protein